ncbi:MAG TPA: plastocyanin/azurin family copper-binding protein [Terriglobales bacterium]
MIRIVLFVVLSGTALLTSALAGDIQGKVSGATGTSVVYVDAIAGKTFPPPAQHFQIDQKGLMFQPHVLVIPVGATVDFQNSDSVQHNLFWPSINGNKKLGHNLGTWPKGEKRSFQFDQPGAISLLCNVHPEMSGYLVVSPTPYFAETDGGGNFKISNVPDGKYNVVAWHEGTKPQTKSVDVAGSAKVEFSLLK